MRSTHHDPLHSNRLRNLEPQKEPQQHQEIPPPQISDLQIKTRIDVIASDDVRASGFGSEEGADLVGTEVVGVD